MKMPTKCPVCGDVLMTQYFSAGVKDKFNVFKECTTRLDHWIRFSGPEGEDSYSEVTVALSRDPILRAQFSYKDNRIVVLPGTLEEIIKLGLDERPTIIPFFEPDLEDYKALVQKLKTYLVFS